MLRHALASLFGPRSLVIVADRPLPGAAVLPAALVARTTRVDVPPGVAPDIPAHLTGLADDERPDLGLVCVSPSVFAETLRRLTPRAPRALIVLPHEEPDPYPRGTVALCQAWAQENHCQLLGPRAFGVQRPHAGYNFSQHPTLARSGRVALVAQSRSIIAAVMDWAEDVHIGFSTAIALGDEAIVKLGPVLDYLATDPRTDSIALYLEDVGPAREFISALRAAASVKPVVVLKAGRGQDDDAVFDAVLRRAGAVRVRYFVQLFSAVKVLGYARRPRGRRVALLSNGSGPPQLALDLLGPDAAVERADLAPASRQALEALLEPGAAVANPVITTVPLTPDRIEAALGILNDDPQVDGVLVLLAPDALADMRAVAERLAQVAPRARKPIVSCFMGDAGMRPLRRMLDDAGTSAFRTPESAADAFGVLSTHFYNQQLLLQTQTALPQAVHSGDGAAHAIVRGAREAGRLTLEPAEARDLLAAFQVPVQDTMPVGLYEPLSRPLAIRVQRDAHFGPVIRFGAGGPDAVLSLADRGMDLPPLNGFLARQLIERSRIWRKVLATRLGTVVTEALQQALVQVSELITELPDVASLDIDPLYAGETRLYARSLRVTLTADAAQDSQRLGGYPHMAIHPYPSRLVQDRTFADGTPWVIRPIRPEDGEALQDFIRNLSERSRYMRFVSMMRELTPRMLARYTQVDYDREVALVATTEVPNPAHRGHLHEVIIGLAHYLRNPDGRGAEYALVLRDDWQGRGLGGQLMQALIAAAREQGLEYIDGLVLAANRPMLTLMQRLGFTNDPAPDDDATMRRLWLRLDGD
ncbi:MULTISPECIES: GNAT family N-acetyltransferase [unclassified Achromobacter]|uniref:bifunctional acetate--CoA ligase family protein/GNAT family N-acetyltransferase n=1 Tax=unclassified Achromobacter TaxID=2626865 RepID=UPI000B51927A|nr:MULTISPECIES: GNAT family N-acetyltransferase [unclassified Achromobacter]OWT75581.1 GNAT family N-acetyltransferase [Achromobacter sp. HZ28]OWT76242.1 GNAT family N-acetyltransferase [Achromobacter sp. HZ34]